MPRTTVDIDGPILEDLKRLQKREHKSLGRLISDLLAKALSSQKSGPAKPKPFKWLSKDMGTPLVDLEDKDAVHSILDVEMISKLRK